MKKREQPGRAIVDTSAGVYGDLSSSDTVTEHGAWADKLPLIDADIAALKLLPALRGLRPEGSPKPSPPPRPMRNRRTRS
ncbi:MAG: hypothetical protein WDN06_16080 [Asticcacaulis sp.]